MHVQPRYNPLAKSDFFADQRAARPLVEGTVARGELARGHLFLYRQARQQRRRLHAVPGDSRESRTRPRALQHLLLALPLARGRRQRLHPVARLRSQAAFLPHRAPAESARRLFLRRDRPNGFGIMLDYSSQISSARSLVDRGLHSRAAIEPERNQRRCPRRTGDSLEGAGLLSSPARARRCRG